MIGESEDDARAMFRREMNRAIAAKLPYAREASRRIKTGAKHLSSKVAGLIWGSE